MTADTLNAERRFRLLRGRLWRCVGRGQGAKGVACIEATMTAIFTYKLNNNTLVFEKGNEGEVRDGGGRMKQEVDLEGRRLFELPPKVPRLFGRSCPQSTRLGTGYFIQHTKVILLLGTKYLADFYYTFSPQFPKEICLGLYSEDNRIL